jgi:hypothetical protein
VKDACQNLAENVDDKGLKGTFLELKNKTKDDEDKLGDHIFEISDRF